MTKSRGGTQGGDGSEAGRQTRGTDGSTVVENTRLSYEPDSVVSN
ncbi:hypothetical protein EGH25_02765 [Haladaptatus sp. F3-133]|uniref:Uncharacterized protein n=1 Tax=Halorutilus salinus TaxID=2487751 RepID=A0A9Q4C4F6_9EURY|nr:hypothetical protein [Halorutilus salinus]MCX2818274.1 hypothetical protein [Halorutilus salinus]